MKKSNIGNTWRLATNETQKATTEVKTKQMTQQLQVANQKVTKATVAKMTDLETA
jgi:hypothetical protein